MYRKLNRFVTIRKEEQELLGTNLNKENNTEANQEMIAVMTTSINPTNT